MKLNRQRGRRTKLQAKGTEYWNVDITKANRGVSVPSVLAIFLALLIGFYLGMTINVYLGAFTQDMQGPAAGAAAAASKYKLFTCPMEDEVHVLYTISGQNKNFLDEFSGSLKSSLLNGPLDCGMTIHIMTDATAYKAIHPRFESIQLSEWVARNQIAIKSYNVENRKSRWQSIFEEATNYQLSKRHTIGAMFRLFAFEVLPPTVKYVVYMDTDTAVLSNLGDLWRHRNATSILQWGDAKCSGFGLDQMRTRDFWKLVKGAHSIGATTKDEIDDQYILRKLSNAHPDLFPYLPEQWNLHRADNFWHWKGDGTRLVKNVPKAAMVHMNGFTEGEGNEHNKFDNASIEYGNVFWAMRYYGGHPWEWTRYMLESQIRNRRNGFQITVEYHIIE
ncbi:unnamed protein product [Cylindrotheca closterium]|uniref:Uncharacterized protein n=1 Tax=Cylindrotheca closterium TaxID=2856 RepID=A0AAD2CVN0_9STRA|nr:unnamed protein product [Cylindrotheca closterium]